MSELNAIYTDPITGKSIEVPVAADATGKLLTSASGSAAVIGAVTANIGTPGVLATDANISAISTTAHADALATVAAQTSGNTLQTAGNASLDSIDAKLTNEATAALQTSIGATAHADALAIQSTTLGAKVTLGGFAYTGSSTNYLDGSGAGLPLDVRNYNQIEVVLVRAGSVGTVYHRFEGAFDAAFTIGAHYLESYDAAGNASDPLFGFTTSGSGTFVYRINVASESYIRLSGSVAGTMTAYVVAGKGVAVLNTITKSQYSVVPPTFYAGPGQNQIDIKGRLLTRNRTTATTITSVLSSITSGSVLAANTSRGGAKLANNSTSLFYGLYGNGTASPTNYSFVLAPLTNGVPGVEEVPYGYEGVIQGVWATANGSLIVTEFT